GSQVPKDRVMVDPDHAYGEEAGDVSDELRPLAEQIGEQLPRRHLGDGELHDQQGDGDGEDAVGECLEPGSVHLPTTWGGRRGPAGPRRGGRIVLSMPLLEDLRRRRRRVGRARAAAAAVTAQPPADHDAAIAARLAAATTGVEPLGDAAHLRAPRDVLVKALLGLPGDSDPLSTRLISEAGDPPRGSAFLLFGRAAEIRLRQRAHDHDLVILDRDLYSLEPAVWESSGKPTLDRTELFFIHDYIITTQI